MPSLPSHAESYVFAKQSIVRSQYRLQKLEQQLQVGCHNDAAVLLHPTPIVLAQGRVLDVIVRFCLSSLLTCSMSSLTLMTCSRTSTTTPRSSPLRSRSPSTMKPSTARDSYPTAPRSAHLHEDASSSKHVTSAGASSPKHHTEVDWVCIPCQLL